MATTKKASARAAKAVGKKTSRTAKATKANGERMSQMAAAERVLAEIGEPMNCKAMVEAMARKGYWSSPCGKTPHATLYAALLRHIRKHGSDARFVRADRGKFALAGRGTK